LLIADFRFQIQSQKSDFRMQKEGKTPKVSTSDF